jgi:hypothetical protein
VADPVVARELKALREEIAALQRARTAPQAPAASAAAPAAGAPPFSGVAAEAAEADAELRGQLHDFVAEATKFFEEAEKNVAAHPAASVVGALVLGVFIGRLLGRR